MSTDNGSLAIGAIQQKMARKIDPEQLQLMGKQAAAIYTKTGKPLSEAVVEVAKHASLSPEQVKRVCEFANTTAYLDAFEKSGELRNVTFEHGPADPSAVLKDLNDGSVPAIHQLPSEDYSHSPRDYKTAGVMDSALAEAFLLPQGLEKSASQQEIDTTAHANPIEELYDLQMRLKDVRDQYMSKLSSCEIVEDDCANALRNTVLQEVRGGTPIEEITHAWSVEHAPHLVKHAVAVLHENGELKSAWDSRKELQKTASKIPNPNHPVVDLFTSFTKIAEQRLQLKHLVDVLDEQLGVVNSALRSALHGLHDA